MYLQATLHFDLKISGSSILLLPYMYFCDIAKATKADRSITNVGECNSMARCVILD